jgi:hypothetical protein
MSDKHWLNMLIAAVRSMSDEQLQVLEKVGLIDKIPEYALNIIRREEDFLVVGENEPFYLETYDLIRKCRMDQGYWTFEDEIKYRTSITKIERRIKERKNYEISK